MKEIDSDKKMYLLLGVLLLIIFFIGTNILRNKRNQVIDYDNINGGQNLLNSATVTYDREVYYILDDIIGKYIQSYEFSETIEGETSYKDYYEVLSKSYQYKLGKKKYIDIADKFLSKFLIISQGTMENQRNLVSFNVIRSIYQYDLKNDMYVCLVGVKDSANYGYIGIKLNRQNNTYEIFYIE